jgi:beta-phosphoglucomutase-like phosphatase (HAD superfamily)
VLASWLHLYEHSGHELDLDRWLDTVGGDVDARYDALAGLVGDAFDLAAARQLRRTFELGLVGDLPLRDGFAELLDRAAVRGLRLAVVSSSPAEWVRGHLGRLGLLDRFELVITREDAARAKPHPDLYLVALDRLGLPAEQALVVEDAVNGAAAAHAAGLEAVVVPNPVTVRQQHGHVTVLPDARVLWAHVQQRLGSY